MQKSTRLSRYYWLIEMILFIGLGLVSLLFCLIYFPYPIDMVIGLGCMTVITGGLLLLRAKKREKPVNSLQILMVYCGTVSAIIFSMLFYYGNDISVITVPTFSIVESLLLALAFVYYLKEEPIKNY